MRVVLNDRVLLQRLTGVGYYVQQLLWHMNGIAPDVRIEACLTSHWPLRNLNRKIQPRVVAEPGKSHARTSTARTVRWTSNGPRFDLWRRWWVRRIAEKTCGAFLHFRAGRHDLYHEPNHIPIRCNVPTVTTIHDLSVLVHPDWHPADRLRWYEREFDRGRRQTCRFIAASEFTKREMVQRLGIPADRIDVTYQAPRDGFKRIPGAVVDATLTDLGLPRQFFLFVGTLEPRKNVLGLLDAYLALPVGVRQRHPLVLVGGWGWNTDALREKLDGVMRSSSVRLVGYVNDEVLACLFSACTALVWPSFYEGFGLPPLEAMACGSPVIVSRAASLPEVVGDAGVLLDPQDLPSWTEAMRRMTEDAAWREEWRERGSDRAANFTWQRCARQTIACYQTALRTL